MFQRELLWKGILLPIGAAVGVAMVLLELTQWDILFTTLTVAFSASTWMQNQFSKDHMQKKTWQIDVGLMEGYDEGNAVHTQDEFLLAYQVWMKSRIKEGLPIVQGGVDFRMLVYPVRNNGEGGVPRILAEESARIVGELSPVYDAKRTDDEILHTIQHLARYLLDEFHQHRVYYSYLNTQYVVDATIHV